MSYYVLPPYNPRVSAHWPGLPGGKNYYGIPQSDDWKFSDDDGFMAHYEPPPWEECPDGEQAPGLRIFRGFGRLGDKGGESWNVGQMAYTVQPHRDGARLIKLCAGSGTELSTWASVLPESLQLREVTDALAYVAGCHRDWAAIIR